MMHISFKLLAITITLRAEYVRLLMFGLSVSLVCLGHSLLGEIQTLFCCAMQPPSQMHSPEKDFFFSLSFLFSLPVEAYLALTRAIAKQTGY